MEANQTPNQEIAGITINSYASPEGSLEFNTSLAEKREANTTKLMESQLKKDKITEFGELTASFTPEDWEGFEKLVEKSNIQDKDLIISVLKLYPDPVDREREIRNLSSVFNELADQILPQLRYSRVMATINTLGKSDQELVDLFNKDPKQLTEEEILYIATLTDDNLKKMEVYNTAAELNSKDYRTFNNLGMTQYVAGDYEGAQANFEHAHRLNGRILSRSGRSPESYPYFRRPEDQQRGSRPDSQQELHGGKRHPRCDKSSRCYNILSVGCARRTHQQPEHGDQQSPSGRET